MLCYNDKDMYSDIIWKKNTILLYKIKIIIIKKEKIWIFKKYIM
jgi:hypothetical protein